MWHGSLVTNVRLFKLCRTWFVYRRKDTLRDVKHAANWHLLVSTYFFWLFSNALRPRLVFWQKTFLRWSGSGFSSKCRLTSMNFCQNFICVSHDACHSNSSNERGQRGDGKKILKWWSTSVLFSSFYFFIHRPPKTDSPRSLQVSTERYSKYTLSVREFGSELRIACAPTISSHVWLQTTKNKYKRNNRYSVSCNLNLFIPHYNDDKR